VGEHKDNVVDSFTHKRGVHNLVYVEGYDDIRKSISREKSVVETGVDFLKVTLRKPSSRLSPD